MPVIFDDVDLSDLQRELTEMNDRYDTAGDRLGDRKQELANTLDKVKSYLVDVQVNIVRLTYLFILFVSCLLLCWH